MKRFWLLLLAVLMPLQMSWAAVHFCADEMPLATVHAVEAVNSHHQHAAPSKAADKDVSGEPSCGAVHSCHGLHNIMPLDDADAAIHSPSLSLPGFLTHTIPGAYPARHERPQWTAA